VGDEVADHIDIAVPGGEMERGVARCPWRGWQASRRQAKDGGSGCCCVGHADDTAGSVGGKLLEQLRMVGKDPPEVGPSPTSAA